MIPANFPFALRLSGLPGSDLLLRQRARFSRRSAHMVTSLCLIAGGYACSFYSGIGWLDGAQCNPCSLLGLLFGIGLLLAGCVIALAGARRGAARIFIYLSAITSLMAWVVALGISQRAGFSTWLWSVLALIVIGMIYWIVTAMTTRRGGSYAS